MKILKLTLALLLLGTAGIGSAWADRSHVHFGVTIGPYWGPGYYPGHRHYYPYYPPYVYYPPVVIERQEAQVYIEQPPPAVAVAPPAPVAAPPAISYWYYCAAQKAYYPYVKECPSGWQKVLPQPPGQP